MLASGDNKVSKSNAKSFFRCVTFFAFMTTNTIEIKVQNTIIKLKIL